MAASRAKPGRLAARFFRIFFGCTLGAIVVGNDGTAWATVAAEVAEVPPGVPEAVGNEEMDAAGESTAGEPFDSFTMDPFDSPFESRRLALAASSAVSAGEE
jgi:hypothetical protein